MRKSAKYILGVLSGGLVLLLFFQNCAQTSFDQVDPASNSDLSSTERTSPPTPANIPVILPSLVEDESAGISKLLVFVGGNAALQVEERQNLVFKIDKILENLRGRDIEILVTSLTIANNANPPVWSQSGRADGGEVIRLNENPALKVLMDQNTIYGSENSAQIFAKFKPYFGKDIVYTGQHLPYDKIGSPNHFKISRNQWDKDYSAIKAKLIKVIKTTSDDSSVDGSKSYLCKVAKYLADPRAEAIIKPTDKVGIVIVSDKDDEGTGSYYGAGNCALTTKSVTSIYPEFTWYMGEGIANESGGYNNLVLKETDYLPDSSEGVVNMDGIVSCISSNLPDADLCNSGFYCGKEYFTNVLDYASKKMGDKYKPGVCKKTYEEGFHRMEMSGLPRRLWQGKKPYMGRYIAADNVDVQTVWAFSEADMKAGGVALGFSNFAKKKFGKNVHFTMVVNTADGACGAGKTVAKRYLAVAQQMGTQGQVVPFCK